MRLHFIIIAELGFHSFIIIIILFFPFRSFVRFSVTRLAIFFSFGETRSKWNALGTKAHKSGFMVFERSASFVYWRLKEKNTQKWVRINERKDVSGNGC